MAGDLDLAELVEGWTLVDGELGLLVGKWGHTRLGFALMLKFFQREGYFPSGQDLFGDDVVEFVAGQLSVDPAEIDRYPWSGRTNAYHRGEVRDFLGFRECTAGDADQLTSWLAGEVAVVERSAAVVTAELGARCWADRIELPTAGRVDRMVRSALARSERQLTASVADLLGVGVRERLNALIGEGRPTDDGDDQTTALAVIKSSPGNVSLDSMLAEIAKLGLVRQVGVPAEAFEGIAPRVVSHWRARAAVEAPSHLRRHTGDLRVTLLAALVHEREREITDALVELLISTVHRINARADRKVTSELTKAFKKVTGKENILFSIAEAALDDPDAVVRDVVFPAVKGGEATLRDLVAEFKANGPTYRRTVQTTLRASYTNHYRRGLVELLEVLEFRSNNDTHRPVLEALDLVRRYRGTGTRFFPSSERVPTHRGIVGDWSGLVFDGEGSERRVIRSVYEICTFQALREQLRCKEIWVVGADRWRNPDQDLPTDFDEHRVAHYAALRQPLDPTEFIDTLRTEMTSELEAFDDELPSLDWVEIGDRGRQGAIKLTPIPAVGEPANLRGLKTELQRRWGTVPMIDILKEAVLRSGCLEQVTSTGSRDNLDVDILAERLLLVLYSYGTNTGIRAVAGGEHGHTEDDLRYVRRRYLSTDVVQAMAIEIANATFAARQSDVWGVGSSAVGSDSTHFRALDQNIFTEWHARYRGRGVLIYWHVERKSVAIHSQLISCSASEVAAMIEGTMRHGTDMNVEGNYVDSHGQSEIGFGITRLLGFDLLPRIKRINHVKLYRPIAGAATSYPNLQPALTRPIRWELIAEQYDQMIKYATAIRTGTASTEAILRRFTTANSIHPTYQAMIETGRAQKTVFVARYLRDRGLQREINAGLNVVESWNRGQSIVFYGKGGDLSSNDRDEQELSVLCLRVLQAALVYINTLMIQDVLSHPDWADRLTADDRRGLTPLFWSHIAPYGEVRLNMTRRLDL